MKFFKKSQKLNFFELLNFEGNFDLKLVEIKNYFTLESVPDKYTQSMWYSEIEVSIGRSLKKLKV